MGRGLDGWIWRDVDANPARYRGCRACSVGRQAKEVIGFGKSSLLRPHRASPSVGAIRALITDSDVFLRTLVHLAVLKVHTLRRRVGLLRDQRRK